MVIQYPHIIKFTTSADSVQDATGNFTPGAQATVEKKCRMEPNGGNGYVTATDGRRIDFSWTVYLPLPQDRIKEGALVELFDEGVLLSRDTVKRFSKGQLNARVWL